MNQLEAIEKITSKILEDGLVEALFLKGSIAAKTNDAVSDVDLYAIVSEDKWDYFKTKRIMYLESFMPLMYFSEVDFVGPQIVGIFTNGLHFDLYMITKKSIPTTGPIDILHDPHHLLDNYQMSDLSLTEDEVVRMINTFSYTLIEVYAAIVRDDTVWFHHLMALQMSSVSCLWRHLYDPSHARLGAKRIMPMLPKETIQSYQAFNALIASDEIEAVKRLISMMDRVIELLSKTHEPEFNRVFYEFNRQRFQIL